MTILHSLVRAYDRLEGVPAFGYSPEKVSYVISLNVDGSVADVIDIREAIGKKVVPREMMVPRAVKRTAGVAPNFLWDKTSYVLGVSAEQPAPAKDDDAERVKRRKAAEKDAGQHAAFVKFHEDVLAESDDEGLVALRAFLAGWLPSHFEEPRWPSGMRGANVVFSLESERIKGIFIHDRPAARALWAGLDKRDDADARPCLVTGERAASERLHPTIKNVWGAQSSGASLVSFNLDSFTSYGKTQGDNAPVSERAAFAYGAALNRMLTKDSGHRIQIGDASTVFWADASDRKLASDSEALFAMMFDPKEAADATEKVENARLRDVLSHLREGSPLYELDYSNKDGVEFNVLGLSPNASRLSVRFHYSNTFGELAKNYQRFVADMRLDPPPRGVYPPLWQYLRETAVRIPMKPAIDSETKPATCSDFIPASIPI